MPCAGVRCLYDDGTGRDGTDHAHAYPGLGGAVQYMTRTRLFGAGAAVARSIARMVWRSIADVRPGSLAAAPLHGCSRRPSLLAGCGREHRYRATG